MKVLVAPRAIAAGMVLFAGLSSAAQAGWVAENGDPVAMVPQGPGWTEVGHLTLRYQPSSGGSPREFKWDQICKTWRDVDTGEESKTWDTTYESLDVSDKDRLFSARPNDFQHVHWVACDDKKPPRRVRRYETGYDGWSEPSNLVPMTSNGFPTPQSVYVQAYGGLTIPGTVLFSSPDDLNSGAAFGGSIGVVTSIPGVSVQLDVDHTHQEFREFPGDFISTTSVAVLGVADFNGDGMADLVTPAPGSPQPPVSPIDFYVGAGPAVQFLSEDYSTGGTVAGFGYKALAGVRFAATNNVSFFGQGQYENTFGTNVATNHFPVQSGNFSVVGGIRISLPWTPSGK